MSFFNKKVVFKPLASLRGQATVEYILLLVVVMLIAFGIGGPLGKHLRDFSGAMIGPDGYYACLTKEGLLPGNSSASDCGKYSELSLEQLGDISSGEAFNEVSGLNGGANSAGSDSNRDSLAEDSKESENNKKSSRHKAARSKNSNSGSGGSAGGAGSDSGQASSGDSSNRQEAFLASLDDDSQEKRKTKKKKKRFRRKRKGAKVEDPFKNNKKTNSKSSSRSRVNQGEGYLGDQSYFGEEEEEKQRLFKVTTENKKANTGQNKEEGDKSRVEDRKPTGDSQLNDENKGMNFTGFLKYIVIAIMIIAILIVIFSQVMEYQNRD